jgi:cytoskeletal protein CcmA (bactofilin family)
LLPALDATPENLGQHTIRVYARDQLGNLRGHGPYALLVLERSTTLTVEAGPDQILVPGEIFTLDQATFQDSVTAGEHTALVDWGDGTSEPGTVSESGGSGTVSGSHAYAGLGDYTVTVCVTDDGGLSACDSFTIGVGSVRLVVDAGNDQTAVEGESVALDPATFEYAGMAGTSTATVNWGDGSTEPGEVSQGGGFGTVTGSHVYLDNGMYAVEVCVANGASVSACDSLMVTVYNAPPNVEAGDEQTTLEGAMVTLGPAAFGDVGVLDTHSATVDWGDGYSGSGEVTESDGTGAIAASHVYADEGDFTVEVCVSDNDGGVACDSFAVVVYNAPPSVEAGPDQTAHEGEVVALAPASYSDAGLGDWHTASVDWGDGSPVQAVFTRMLLSVTGGLISAEHVYADESAYTVQVCVVDSGNDAACDQLVVTVENSPPTVEAGSDVVIFEGDGVTLGTTTFMDPGTLDSHTATIDWGDGAVEPGVVTEEPFGPPGSADGMQGSVSGSHVFAVPPGVYAVTVTVTDDDGGVASDSLQITVQHGFLRFCLYADGRAGLNVDQGAVIDCQTLAGSANLGGAASRERLSVNGAATIQGRLVSLEGDVELRRGAQLAGDITAYDDVRLVNHASVVGDVAGGGDIHLTWSSSISGDATAGGTVELDRSSTIGGDIQEHADLPAIPPVTFVRFDIRAGSQDITVVGGWGCRRWPHGCGHPTQATLAPGVYRDLMVMRGATLILESGSYTFRRILMHEGANLVFDLSGGPISIDVAGDVILMDGVEMSIGSAQGGPTDVLFRIGGHVVDLHRSGVFLGTFMAPRGRIVLFPDATLIGALYANAIEVLPRARVSSPNSPGLSE